MAPKKISMSSQSPRAGILNSFRDCSIDNNELTYELFDDGWEKYQEPYITLN